MKRFVKTRHELTAVTGWRMVDVCANLCYGADGLEIKSFVRQYHIITLGCQMNVSDSERVAAVFEHLNYSATKKPDMADVIVINACSVRQTAIDRIWGLTRDLGQLRHDKSIKLVLTGCVLPEDKEKLAERFDLIFEIKKLAELEKFLHRNQDFVGENYFNVWPKSDSPFSRLAPIMTGCDNYCSYCAVPYVRGREQSRPVKEVLAEIKELVRFGAKEICLLGQNVNSYDPPDKENFFVGNPFQHDFAKLLWEVNRVDGVARINFASSHPKDVSDEMIEALKLPKQLNYLHLAVQSGDDSVLANMNRQYTIADFEKLIQKIRLAKPGIAIGTDIIVGFPGETRAQFENTLRLYKRVRFDIAYLARYSPRAGTAAAKLVDDVPREEKKRRWRELQTLMEKIVLKKNQKYIGQTVEVLIDKVGKDFVEGNSREMKRVRVYDEPSLKRGDFVGVKVDAARMWILSGRVTGR